MSAIDHSVYVARHAVQCGCDLCQHEPRDDGFPSLAEARANLRADGIDPDAAAKDAIRYLRARVDAEIAAAERRGAETMRERCAMELERGAVDRLVYEGDGAAGRLLGRAAEILRKLPLPGDPAAGKQEKSDAPAGGKESS